MPDFLPVLSCAPPAARAVDYCGLWAIEWTAALGLWQQVAGCDLDAHMAAAVPAGRPASTMEMAPAKGGKSTAVVKAAGTLMKAQSSFGGTSSVQLRRDIRAAANDPNVGAILIAIDSPGGTVAGTADLAADVKAARRKKPVWAYVEDLGASAAYWLASQADAIYANSPTALVGSVGMVMTVHDVSAAAEREGVKTMVFRTGPLKGIGAPGAPVTDEQAAHLQQLVNEAQTHFDAAVRNGRGLTAAQLAAVRTGGLFAAAEAVDKRLIDGIKSFDSTLEALAAAR